MMKVIVSGKCDYSFGGDKRIDLRYLNTVEHPTRKQNKTLVLYGFKKTQYNLIGLGLYIILSWGKGLKSNTFLG